MKQQSILSLTLAMAPQTSFGALDTNKARLTRQDVMKLTGAGHSDSVMLSGARTLDKTFDVFLSSALHNFVVTLLPSGSQEVHSQLRKKSTDTTGERRGQPERRFLGENVIASNSQSRRSLSGTSHK